MVSKFMLTGYTQCTPQRGGEWVCIILWIMWITWEKVDLLGGWGGGKVVNKKMDGWGRTEASGPTKRV